MRWFASVLCAVALSGALLLPLSPMEPQTPPLPPIELSGGVPVSPAGFYDIHADAGPNQTSDEGSLASFDGRGSYGSANYTGVGLSFVKDSGVRVAPGGPADSTYAGAPDIVRLPNGSFRMYYWGRGGPDRILSAFSTNGFDWVKEPGIRVDVGGTYDSAGALYPHARVLANGTYRMYYTGNDGSVWRVLSAISADGIAWSKESGVRIDPGGLYDPVWAFGGDVVAAGGFLRMYYSGGTSSTYRILSATSVDGLNWTKESGIRIDLGGPLQSRFVAQPGVTNIGGGALRMYYHGSDGTHSRMFSATSTDGLNFTLDPGIRIDNGPVYDSVTLGYPEVLWVNVSAIRLYYAGYDGSNLYVLSALSQPTRYPIAAYSWDFDARIDGDGNGNFTDDADAVGAQVSHQYDDNGVYTVTLQVRDANNSVASDATWVTVANRPPVISVSPPLPSVEGLPVAVNITLTDPGSDDLRLTWFWQYASGGTSTFFNNGVSPDPPNSSAGTAPFVVSQPLFLTYNDDGIYSLYVNATDDDGGAAAFVSAIVVQNGAPAPFVVMGPLDVPIGAPRGYSANVSDPGTDDLTFSWDWGDASFNSSVHYNNGISPDPDPSPWGQSPFAPTDMQMHAWSSAGTYRIGVTVRDDDGGFVTATLDVRVHARPFVSIAVGDPHRPGPTEYVTSHSPITFDGTDQSGFGLDHIEYRIDNGSWLRCAPGTSVFITPEGARQVDARSVDGIGGVSDITSRVLVVDDTPPTSDLAVGSPRYTAAGMTYVTSDTPLTISGVDGGVVPVGLAVVEYRFDSDPTWRTYGSAVSLIGLAEGEHSVWVRAADELGNVEAQHPSVLVLDDTPPTSDLSVGNPRHTSVGSTYVTSGTPLTLGGVDGGVTPVGMAGMEYRFDAEASWRAYGSAFSFTGLAEGVHSVWVRATDELGNVETPHAFDLVLDDTPPTSDLVIGTPLHVAAGATYVSRDTPLNLSGIDGGAIPVGLAVVEYRFDADPTWLQSSAAFSLAGLTEGAHSIWIRATDELGNVEAPHAFELVLDGTPPSSVIVVRQASESTQTLNVTSADSGCGVASVEVSVDGAGWSPNHGDFTVSGYGAHTVRYRATDCVGNVEASREYALEIAPPLNVKPFLAVVFALVMIVLGLYLRSRRKGHEQRSRVLYGAVAFAVIELVTGITSLFLGDLLRVPPVLGLGTVVDVVILVAGLVLTWALARPQNEATSPPPEE